MVKYNRELELVRKVEHMVIDIPAKPKSNLEVGL